MQSLYTPPLRFEPGMETVPDDEAAVIAELADVLRSISAKTHADGGHGLRSVHAKSHGVVHGELRVLDELPVELSQGVFAKPARFPATIRLSTTPGDLLDDRVSTPRGFALKLREVDGERLDPARGERVQDFLFVDGPALDAADARAFLKNLRLLAPTTDRAAGLKQALSAVLRGVEAIVESTGAESGTLRALGGHPLTHILGETFYTQVPTLYGDYIAKLAVAPISPALIALRGARLDLHDRPNGIRDAVVDFFADHDAEWEVRVQLCTDLDSMPIEDATVVWPEERSPYVAVARLHVPRQAAWLDGDSPAVEDRLFFSPWHGIAAHRPLGSIQRARRRAYEASAQFRAAANHVPIDGAGAST